MKHETQGKSKKKKRLEVRGEKWKDALKFRQMRNCREKRTRRNRRVWEGMNGVVR
jgi:hypothetical protein